MKDSLISFFGSGAFGTIVGLFSLILAIYFYAKSRRFRSISAYKVGYSLISPIQKILPEAISITYNGSPVSRLSSTTAYIWNSGTETINGNQIVSSDPLRITIKEDGRFLKYSIISCTRNINGISLEEHNNEIIISFDYLDPMDGFKVELLHDSHSRAVRVVGSVRGIPKGVNQTYALDMYGDIDQKNINMARLQQIRIDKSAKEGLGCFAVVGVILLFLSYFEYNSRSVSSLIGIEIYSSVVVTLMVVWFLTTLASILFVIMADRRPYPSALDHERQIITD